MWYHGTTRKTQDLIFNHGFSLDFPRKARRFGDGIYFASHREEANKYGEVIVEAHIKEADIFPCTIEDWDTALTQLIRLHQNDFANHIADFIQSKGYKALCITYLDGEHELVVYDLSAISMPVSTSK